MKQWVVQTFSSSLHITQNFCGLPVPYLAIVEPFARKVQRVFPKHIITIAWLICALWRYLMPAGSWLVFWDTPACVGCCMCSESTFKASFLQFLALLCRSLQTANYIAAQAWMKFSAKLNYQNHKPFQNHLHMQSGICSGFKNNKKKTDKLHVYQKTHTLGYLCSAKPGF